MHLKGRIEDCLEKGEYDQGDICTVSYDDLYDFIYTECETAILADTEPSELTEKKSAIQWKDRSVEAYREYRFPEDEVVVITDPIKLAVSENGHRIVDADGVGHYIPKGWIHLLFVSKDGNDPYVF